LILGGAFITATACGDGTASQPIAQATAEGVAADSGEATLESATEAATSTTAVSATPTTSAEPEVTVAPPVPVEIPPVPPLERIQPAVVTLDFAGSPIGEVRPGSAPGPGAISQLGEVDTFTFPVQKGQSFIVEQLGGCSFDGDRDFISLDARGAGENRGFTFMDGDCRSIMRLVAETTDVMELEVESSSNGTVGQYSFRVVDVTDPGPLPLASGDVIYPNDPAGYGWIEGFGHHDVFTFEATKDRPFIIRQLGTCGFDGSKTFVAADLLGQGINGNAIISDKDCTTVDRFEPETSGPVEIVVRSGSSDVFGYYSFQIYELVTTDAEAADAMTELDAVDTADGTVISLNETVLFDFGSSTLRRDADEVLIKVAEVLRFEAPAQATVIGHTDSVGSTESNGLLSQDRAEAVVDRLVELGVTADSLIPEGRGELEPIAPNVAADGSDDPDGRAMNRRVEIVVAP
jgi:outer membrane protein OmpA-like peptidoglycan-associated protein